MWDGVYAVLFSFPSWWQSGCWNSFHRVYNLGWNGKEKEECPRQKIESLQRNLTRGCHVFITPRVVSYDHLRLEVGKEEGFESLQSTIPAGIKPLSWDTSILVLNEYSHLFVCLFLKCPMNVPDALEWGGWQDDKKRAELLVLYWGTGWLLPV